MNKSLDYYMNLEYPMEITPDLVEGGYTINFPDLPGCVTCCNNWEDIQNIAKDAKMTWFSSELENNREIPLPYTLDNYSGQYKLRMPKSLHKQLSMTAKKEGVSLNQYMVYLLSMNNAKKQGDN